MSHLPSFDKLFQLDGKIALVSSDECCPPNLVLSTKPSVVHQTLNINLTQSIRFTWAWATHIATAVLLAGAQKLIMVSRKSEMAQGLHQAVTHLNSLSKLTRVATFIAAGFYPWWRRSKKCGLSGCGERRKIGYLDSKHCGDLGRAVRAYVGLRFR